MNGKTELIAIDLHPDEKKLILDLAGFWVTNETSLADLRNPRKKWIRFNPSVVSELIGELSYHYNRCRNAARSELLDALISHLENVLSGNGHGL